MDLGFLEAPQESEGLGSQWCGMMLDTFLIAIEPLFSCFLPPTGTRSQGLTREIVISTTVFAGIREMFAYDFLAAITDDFFRFYPWHG